MTVLAQRYCSVCGRTLVPYYKTDRNHVWIACPVEANSFRSFWHWLKHHDFHDMEIVGDKPPRFDTTTGRRLA